MASKTQRQQPVDSKAAASRRLPQHATVYEVRFKMSELERFSVEREPGRHEEEPTFSCSIVIREPTPMPSSPAGSTN